MHSDIGYRMLCEDVSAFMELNNPTVFKASKTLEDGKRILTMWQRDLKLANDTRPAGFHLFHCHIVVLVAMRNFIAAYLPDDAGTELSEYHARRSRISASRPESSADFDREHYDEWALWTKGSCEVLELDADHMSIKASRDLAAVLYGRLHAVRHNLEIGGSTEVP
mmetsp:Transcript_63819/g.192628  ORF Transcript_63819/g.192628 Transcript_63819/m.192628 type:complete len:166 (-) Transcript_63819:55-552(-)